MPHPEEEQLLRYSDGELPARASSEVRSHLEACWQCRANLEELEQTVGACVRYRSTVLQRHLPAPPAPWTDIYRSFGEIDATFDQPESPGSNRPRDSLGPSTTRENGRPPRWPCC